jgi:hypothetical protein
VPFWKPLPHKVAQRDHRRKDAAAEERARGNVRQHGHYRCRVCGRPTKVVHEEKRRGAGGRVSLENSYLACDVGDGGICHPLLQNRFIAAVMADGSEAFDARKELIFEMPERIAKRVFDDRTRPPHIRILEGD